MQNFTLLLDQTENIRVLQCSDFLHHWSSELLLLAHWGWGWPVVVWWGREEVHQAVTCACSPGWPSSHRPRRGGASGWSWQAGACYGRQWKEHVPRRDSAPRLQRNNTNPILRFSFYSWEYLVVINLVLLVLLQNIFIFCVDKIKV